METSVERGEDHISSFCQSNPLYDLDMKLSRTDMYTFQSSDLKPAKARGAQRCLNVIVIYLILLTALNAFLLYKVFSMESSSFSSSGSRTATLTDIHIPLGTDQEEDLRTLARNTSLESTSLRGDLGRLQTQVTNLCGEDGQLGQLRTDLGVVNASTTLLQDTLHQAHRDLLVHLVRGGKKETQVRQDKKETLELMARLEPMENQGNPDPKVKMVPLDHKDQLVHQTVQPLTVQDPLGCLPGIPGQNGTKGDTGVQGRGGLKGARGPKGDTGLIGQPGPIGPEGPRGPAGVNGTRGFPGVFQGCREVLEAKVHVERRVKEELDQWGTVCDDSFDTLDGTVLCQMLGYQRASTVFTASAGMGKIWLDDLRCKGTETSVFDCPHNGLGVSNCQHNEDAGVQFEPGVAPARSLTPGPPNVIEGWRR
ncbi:unnamed protein product [Coregonus sp. 'balchen']|nr:unnamed protein product [Coregonus sp. 'balchen']